MVLNTGNRTDIPAFYSEWFMNRVREGYALVRSPYAPEIVTRYNINPKIVDIIAFCTKNPAPMLQYLDELSNYRQFWFVTITPYGKDIEPNVPGIYEVMDSLKAVSAKTGVRSVGWRYDPIFISDDYPIEHHIEIFGKMCRYLKGYVEQVVISYIDLYDKTKRNFPEASVVTVPERKTIGRAFAQIASDNGMMLYTCLEGDDMAVYGMNTGGCMTRRVLENAIGEELKIPVADSHARDGCNCILGADIGAYNTCLHFCRYCYANYDKEIVIRNNHRHDPASPMLVGNLNNSDKVREAKQISYATGQLRLDL